MSGPILETERLILRPPRREDFEDHLRFYSDEESTRFIGGVRSRPDAWRHFTEAAGAWFLYGFDKFTVVEKASGSWIGRVGPKHTDGLPELETGWNIARDYTRRGYAREAATAVIDFLLDNVGRTEVIHCIVPENMASRRLAASLGSRLRREGVSLPGSDQPFDLWGQSAAEWRARSR